MPPLVSILVPSYNQGRFIRETLDSIFAQDYRPIEVLVMDGGSADETVEVLESFSDRSELRWWSERDRGVVDAVNKALALARGEIQAIQSSDDLYVEGSIRRAVDALEKSPTVGLVYGDVEYIDATSVVRSRTHLPEFSLDAYLSKRMYIPQPAAFFRKEAADAVGGWREDISYAADAEFFLRIVTHSGAKRVDAVLARYRFHEDQRERAGVRIANDWATGVQAWIKRESPPALLRRKALAGVHLTRARYLSDTNWMWRTAELYRAILRDPTLIAFEGFRRLELIPGRQPVLRILSRVKRALGLPPKRG